MDREDTGQVIERKGSSLDSTLPKTVGEDHLICTSDYSHWDCLCPDSVKMVYERSDLSEGLKRKILSENAARLFGI